MIERTGSEVGHMSIGWVMKDLLDYEKHLEFFLRVMRDLPWWIRWLRIHLAMAGDIGLIAGWGNMVPQAREQLSPCTETAETAHQNQSPCATAKEPM